MRKALGWGGGSAGGLRLEVSQRPLSDGCEQGLRPEGQLGGRLGAGVRVPAVLIAHGFDVAPAPHPPAGDLVVSAPQGAPSPLVLGHLGRAHRASGPQLPPGATAPKDTARHRHSAPTSHASSWSVTQIPKGHSHIITAFPPVIKVIYVMEKVRKC